MAIDRCGNCEQVIGNLEEKCIHLSEVVCQACKKLLEKESQIVEKLGIKKESESSIQEVPLLATDENKSGQDTSDPFLHAGYGGIGRLGYILGVFGIGFLQGIIEVTSREDPSISAVLSLIVFVVVFGLAVSRLNNIGMSGWWSLLMLIPVVGLYVLIKCIVCPEGYEHTKKLDTAGKVLAGLFLAFIILVVISVIATL